MLLFFCYKGFNPFVRQRFTWLAVVFPVMFFLIVSFPYFSVARWSACLQRKSSLSSVYIACAVACVLFCLAIVDAHIQDIHTFLKREIVR